MTIPSVRDIPVRSVMTTPVVTIDAEQPAEVALRLLGSEATQCVVACRGGQPVGAVTLQELGAVCAVHWPDLSAARLSVRQLMASPVVVVRPEQPLSSLLHLLSKSALEYLVVVDEQGEVVGILEQSKLLRACIRLLGY